MLLFDNWAPNTRFGSESNEPRRSEQSTVGTAGLQIGMRARDGISVGRRLADAQRPSRPTRWGSELAVAALAAPALGFPAALVFPEEEWGSAFSADGSRPPHPCTQLPRRLPALGHSATAVVGPWGVEPHRRGTSTDVADAGKPRGSGSTPPATRAQEGESVGNFRVGPELSAAWGTAGRLPNVIAADWHRKC